MASSGPRTVVCHICGREFGTASIDIHVLQCAKKWEDAEAQKPQHERRPVPTAPPAAENMTREEYNRTALETWDQEALVPCPHCSRTFLPDRLEIHLRSCKPGKGTVQAPGPRKVEPLEPNKPTRSAKNTAPAKPRSVVCHICGREFGTASIDIHVPQCAKKWEDAEAQKPKSARRPVPTAPTMEDGMSRDEYNQAALDKWDHEALVPCPHCARTFLPDRLEIHLRSCKPRNGKLPKQSEGPIDKTPYTQGTKEPAPAKPRTVVCHICGREFGTASIDIHVPQCVKKWEETEAQKPKSQRRPVPSAPTMTDDMSPEEYNQAALEKWDQEALVPCPNCGRTFLPDRLEIHMRSCKPCGGPMPKHCAVEKPQFKPSARETPTQKPPSVVCHICGREFGTSSIDIHVPQCAKKWEEREAQKPKSERRPVPTAPALTGDMSREDYNQAASEKWDQEALVPCPNCGRTFLPDRLEIHARSCKPATGSCQRRGDTAVDKLPAKNDREVPSPKLPAKPRTVVCHICGREFGSASIDIHVPQCAKKWEEIEAQKPASERRPVPTAPSMADEMSREEYNQAALEKWDKEALVPCPHCGRTFLPDRLEIHLRSCRPRDGAKHHQMEHTQEKAQCKPCAKATAAHKPRTIVCHICGREFGSASIDIHVPQCAKKWEEREAQKPASERRPVPSAPCANEEMSREQYNQAALEKWGQEALMPCPKCGRTFLPERLEIHLRSCKPSAASLPRRAEAATSEKAVCKPAAKEAPAAKPRIVVCHICGREFGTASIGIHVPQCAKKWEDAEAHKPPNERRPVPTAPETGSSMGTTDYNQAALDKWDQEALVPCPHCGRTFLPDRLDIHLRSCKPKMPQDPQARQGEVPFEKAHLPEAAEAPKPRTVVCHICGRQFGTASIDIHVRQCARKWEEQETRKPEAEQRPLPKAPEIDRASGLEKYNEAALEKWDAEALEPCPNCNRTFLPDRLQVHLRSCKPKVVEQPPVARPLSPRQHGKLKEGPTTSELITVRLLESRGASKSSYISDGERRETLPEWSDEEMELRSGSALIST